MDPARPFLTLCIPTRNRCGYLEELLASLERQIREAALPPGVFRVIVSDNASTDGTPDLVRGVAPRLPNLVYSPNATNLGAEGNVIKCARAVQGRFGWIAGDDDILNPGALTGILKALEDPDLGLMINLDTNYDPRMPRPRRYPTARDYIQACAEGNPHVLIEHTLLTSNVFRADCFDIEAAERASASNYPHSYGWMTGLKARGGAVLLSNLPAITVRPQRAPAVDGLWPTNLEKSWNDYLLWLRDTFDVPTLRPEAALEHVKNALFDKIRRHPLRFIRNNLPALRQPQAYLYFLKRVWHHCRTRR